MELEEDSSINQKEKYFDGTTFEHIYSLYKFDADLRTLFLKYIDKVETGLSSSLSHVISASYGHRESSYIRTTTFKRGKQVGTSYNNGNRIRIYEVDVLVKRLNECSNKDMKPITYYKREHGYLPPWILFKYLNLGEKERLFNLLKPIDKNNVVKVFQNNFILSKPFTINFYQEAIAIIREFRNTCAHGSRLYNHIHKSRILPYNHLLEFLGVNISSSKGRNDLIAMIISLYAFLGGDRTSDSDWVTFINEFNSLIESFRTKLPEHLVVSLLNQMSLPENYKELCHI